MKLRLWQKMGLAFGIVLVSLIVVGVLNYTGIGKIIANADQINENNKLDGLLAQKEVDHLIWASKVNALFTDDKVTKLDVQTDDHKCAFGEWLNSDSRKKTEARLPSLALMLKDIEEPHRKLHESAVSIEKNFKRADEKLPGFLADKEIDHFKWMVKLNEVFLKSLPELNVETDCHKCALGKWLYSEDAKAATASNEELAKLLEAVKGPHQRLHQSATEIQKVWSPSNQAEARKIYEASTVKALNDTANVLAQLRAGAAHALEGASMAKGIYASETIPSMQAVQDNLHKIRKEVKANVMTEEAMLKAARDTKLLVGGITFLAVIIGVIIAWVLTMRITGPVREVSEGMRKLATGDLTTHINVKTSDEIGEMAGAMNQTIGDLCVIMRDIRSAADQTAASGEELSATAQNISMGSQQQASAVEEISASVETLTATIQNVADNAKQASGVADDTKSTASKGGETVGKSIEGMKLINESSEKISKIIGVISQIASQTNLLALNAAIEAASAGEHGLGFAVVADEVRKLAERSSQATEEITQLIKESTMRVNDGSKLSDEVGESLADILSGIQKTGEAMSSIRSSTAEQAGTASEVAKGMENISAVTEENSGSAEEMSASAEELAAQAQKLQELVSRFKIDDDAHNESAGRGCFQMVPQSQGGAYG